MLATSRTHLCRSLETIVREAGELARVTSRGPFKTWNKSHDHSPVSEGDIAVNNLLHQRLATLVPDAGWLSEETEDYPPARATRLTWIVDPIDGTRAYISGQADWSVSVALIEDGRPILAALYAPISEEMFIATRGEGTTLNGTPLSVSDEKAIIGARLAGPRRYLEHLEKIEPSILPQSKVHSLALRLTRVAQGKFDIAFASEGSHDWDLAAADLLVHEAGGVLTDLVGQPLTYNRPHLRHGALVAAGPTRHAAILALLSDRAGAFA